MPMGLQSSNAGLDTGKTGSNVIKVELNNGFTIIYTQTSDGNFENMDFSHELNKDSKGFYHADLAHLKKDFNDYY